jgi:25S rRNA (uracil2634-N3)-methyltransferase
MGKRLRAKVSGGKLASALLRHQALEKKSKGKSERTARVIEQTKGVPKKVRDNQEAQLSNRKEFIPFGKDNYVLLVGEGDMSFALSVLNEGYAKPSRLIITSYDNSVNELKLKYPNTFEKNYREITQIHKAKVIFKTDATSILKSLRLTPKTLFKILGIPRLDVIMFNFPHTGKGIKDQDRNIRDHQLLVLAYMKSSMELFKLFSDVSNKADSGLNLATDSTEIHSRIVLSVFEGEPYDSWNIKSLSKTLGLKVERSGSFQWDLFPGYQHRRTNSEVDTTKKASERKARIYVFEKFIKEKHSASKRSRDSDSE